MLKIILFILFALSISCASEVPKSDYSDFTKLFITDYANLFPDETPLSIDNLKLSELHIPSDSVLRKVDIFVETYSKTLLQFEQNDVSKKTRQDLKKIRNMLSVVKNYSDKSKTGNQIYDVKIGFERIMNSSYADIDFRLQTLFNKLENVNHFYEAAKNRLSAISQSEIELALNQQTQTFLFFDKTLPDFVNQNHQLTPQYIERLDNAKMAVQDYMAYIESFKMCSEH
jgi:hypothetical protein